MYGSSKVYFWFIRNKYMVYIEYNSYKGLFLQIYKVTLIFDFKKRYLLVKNILNKVFSKILNIKIFNI